MRPAAGDVLVVVDVQNDFLEGGALGIARGSVVLEPLNHALEVFVARGLPVIATRDRHPPEHCSFRERGCPWPVHCVQGTHGAAFHASRLAGDTIHLVDETCGGEPLLVPVLRSGDLVSPLPSLVETRARARRQLEGLPEPLRALSPAPPYPVEISAGIEELIGMIDAKR